jgi:hypothetical protein
MDTAALDTGFRRHVYDITLRSGAPPTIAALASASQMSVDLVRESLTRLAAARVLVLQPSSGEILMAPPFSAVPTPFLVHTSQHTSYANCAWDALGVPVMMREPARVVTACACCGDEMALHTRDGGPPDAAGVIHFAVPARRWWDDILFT